MSPPGLASAYPESQRVADSARMQRMLDALPADDRGEVRYLLSIAWNMGWYDGWADQREGTLCLDPLLSTLT